MLKKLLIVPAIALGVLGFVLLSRGGKGPEAVAPEELARKVRILRVPVVDLLPRATGYGEASPGRVWQAVPQVGGRIVDQEPRLKEGNVILKDTLLVRIDDADYKLEVAQAEAQIKSIEAQLGQLDTKKTTLDSSHEIEKSSLELAQSEFERVKELVKRESLTSADRDREERTYLTQLIRVQEIRNALALIEPDRLVLEARKDLEESRLERAELNVDRTVITAPFDCRIGAVNVETNQVVQAGQVLFSADGIAMTEVPAQIPLSGVRHLLTVGDSPINMLDDPAQALESLGLSAKVRLASGRHGFAWDAEVTRILGIDSQTRTLGIVVAVRDSYKRVRPGVEPPLVKGMYAEVEVFGPVRKGSIVVPRSAMHGDHVYLVDEQGRLESRAIEVGYVQASIAVVRTGLKGGESLILSDLVPAVPGMLLDPDEDEQALADTIADATRGAGTQ